MVGEGSTAESVNRFDDRTGPVQGNRLSRDASSTRSTVLISCARALLPVIRILRYQRRTAAFCKTQDTLTELRGGGITLQAVHGCLPCNARLRRMGLLPSVFHHGHLRRH